MSTEYEVIVDVSYDPDVDIFYGMSLYDTVKAYLDNNPDEFGDWVNAWLNANPSSLAYAFFNEKMANKVNTPLDEDQSPTYGTAGQLLRTKGNGATAWVDEGLPTDEQTAEAVNAWLDEHPEATTTVQDSAITERKLSTALDNKLNDILNRNIMMCISTYRDNVRDNISEFYYAISLDGGKSFLEIDESRSFVGKGIGSDAQPFEYENGLLILATNFDASLERDFIAVYTPDFINYYSQDVNLGFLNKSRSFIDDPYVWTPMISKIGDDYYISASLGIDDNVSGDVYTAGNTTRYLSVYCIKVNIDVSNGLNITPIGEMFEIDFDNPTSSIMDCHILEYNSEIYAIYKDRIYNIVNIAKASNIEDTFYDLIQYCGNMAYTEAGYLVDVDGVLTAYWTGYHPYPYNQKAIIGEDDKLHDIEYIGCVNPKHRSVSEEDVGMRNPYPMIMSNTLIKKFYSVYGLPSQVKDYKVRKKNPLGFQALFSKISNVIYNRFGYSTRYPEEFAVPNTVVENDAILPMYFLNQPTILRGAADHVGVFTLNDGQGTITVRKHKQSASRYIFISGSGAEIGAVGSPIKTQLFGPSGRYGIKFDIYNSHDEGVYYTVSGAVSSNYNAGQTVTMSNSLVNLIPNVNRVVYVPFYFDTSKRGVLIFNPSVGVSFHFYDAYTSDTNIYGDGSIVYDL